MSVSLATIPDDVLDQVFDPRAFFKTPRQLINSIDEYFKDVEKRKTIATISGLAYFCGTNRHTLNLYVERGLQKEATEVQKAMYAAIKTAKTRIEMQLEERLYTARNVIGLIFGLKNNYGWKDAQTVEHTGGIGHFHAVFNAPQELLNAKTSSVNIFERHKLPEQSSKSNKRQ